MILSLSNAQSIGLVGTIIAVGIAALLGWKAISRYRERMLGGEDGGPWTLEDLERLRETGQLSEQEFKALRNQMLQGFMTSGRGKRAGKPSFPVRPNDNINNEQ